MNSWYLATRMKAGFDTTGGLRSRLLESLLHESPGSHLAPISEKAHGGAGAGHACIPVCMDEFMHIYNV